MRAIRHSAAAVALGGLLALAAAPAALADPNSGGDGDAYEVAVGVEAGNIDYNNTPQAPDQGTTVAVGGDSNLGVPQPELGRVPATGSDGIFSIDLSGPNPGVTFDGAPAPSGPASTSAAPADGSSEAAPADGSAEAAPAEGEAPPVPSCADYPSWYDAQLALESTGDAALISSLDPDGNGIACEETMS